MLAFFHQSSLSPAAARGTADLGPVVDYHTVTDRTLRKNLKKRKKEEDAAAQARLSAERNYHGSIDNDDDQGEQKKEKRERRGTRAQDPTSDRASAFAFESTESSSCSELLPEAVPTLEALPNEVFYLILGYLRPRELCRAALVCQQWRNAVADDFLWQGVHAALLGTCSINGDGTGPVWRLRCVAAARALFQYFGLYLGQEDDFSFPSSLPLTKKVERVYPNLLWAVDNGYTRIVERLLARVAALCPNEKTPSGGSAVVASLVNYKWKNTIFSNYDYPEWFQSTLYDSIVRYNDSLLHVAARNGHAALVQLLLASGAVPDPSALDLETPLYFASRYGHLEVMRILVAHKAAVDSANTLGGTPFHRAVVEGQVDAAAYLMSLGANIEHRQKALRNVLHEAALHDRAGLIERLVELSPSEAPQWEEMTDQRDAEGCTPLMVACAGGNVAMVRLLRRLQASEGGPERGRNLADAMALCRNSPNAEALLSLLLPAQAGTE